jgi:hypothetical protein
MMFIARFVLLCSVVASPADGLSLVRRVGPGIEDVFVEALTEERDPPEPILQLREKVKVFLLYADPANDTRHSWRNAGDTKMIREGISMHPFIEMVGEGPGDTLESKQAAEQADFILYLMWGDGDREKCGGTPYCPDLMREKLMPKEKLAVLDFSDGPMRLPFTPPCHVVFKRSLVRKVDGSFANVSGSCGYNSKQPCFPFDYAIRPDNYQELTSKSLSQDRNISVAYLIQDYGNLNETLIAKVSAARVRVKQWLREMDLPSTAVVGYARKSNEKFRNADLVVVADPAGYEGQHAIYEALGNGAVVMANQRWVPMEFPLEEGKHVHYFDICNTEDAKQAFQHKLRELLAQSTEERNAFRLRAWQHSLRYHQAANRVDYVVKTMLEWRGKTPIIPEALRVRPDDSSLQYLQSRCIGPTMKLRAEGKWLTTYPYLKGHD